MKCRERWQRVWGIFADGNAKMSSIHPVGVNSIGGHYPGAMDLIADRGRLFQSPALPGSPWNATIPP